MRKRVESKKAIDANMAGSEKNAEIAWHCVKALAVFSQLAVSVMLLMSLIKMGIVNEFIIWSMTSILAILLIVNTVFLLVRRKTSVVVQIICMILALFCIVGGTLAMRYTDSINGFLDKITAHKVEAKSYSVVVFNDSNIDDASGLQDKSVGFLKTDTKSGAAAEYLQDSLQIVPDYYEDINTMLDVLKNNLTDAIVLESDRLEMLKEASGGSGEAAADDVIIESDFSDGEESIINLVNSLRVIYTYQIELKEDAVVPSKEVTTESFILYISGSDSRGGIKATARSDVNILAVVNPTTSKILLVSIPRDSYVQLHGTTGLRDKLTHAGLYGVNMSKTTIEDLLGITIDYTLKVSFETVVKVVDQLDGIEIDSDTEMSLRSGNNKICYYTVGVQTIDGDCALRFARERKSYYTGDIHRGENQQRVITGIVKKLTSSKEYLLKVPEILEIAADSFETSLTRDDITKFVRMQFANSNDWQIESITVDGVWSHEPTYSMGVNLPLTVITPSEESINSTRVMINEYLRMGINNGK